MIKFNITYFYSEGIPNDNGKDLNIYKIKQKELKYIYSY